MQEVTVAGVLILSRSACADDVIRVSVERDVGDCVQPTLEACVVRSAQGRVHCLLVRARGGVLARRAVNVWEHLLDRYMRRTHSLLNDLSHLRILVFLVLGTQLVALSEVVKLDPRLFFPLNWRQRQRKWFRHILNDRRLFDDSHRGRFFDDWWLCLNYREHGFGLLNDEGLRIMLSNVDWSLVHNGRPVYVVHVHVVRALPLVGIALDWRFCDGLDFVGELNLSARLIRGQIVHVQVI